MKQAATDLSQGGDKVHSQHKILVLSVQKRQGGISWDTGHEGDGKDTGSNLTPERCSLMLLFF